MPLFTPPSNAVPAAPSSTLATAGTAGTYARGDHAHPTTAGFQASDYGFLVWNYDLGLPASGTQLTASGTIFVIKMNVPVAITVTNINLWCQSAGATLTSGQSFAALYGTSKNLLSASADQSTAWTTTGFKQMALSAAQAITPGTYWVALWSNGTTMPGFRSFVAVSSANGNLSAANSRWATADTSITTTGPSTLGAFTAVAGSTWCAFS